MPIYEYHCVACRKTHEIIQKVNEAPLAICPACGGKLEKQLSLSSFQLKGGGWYREGYASVPPAKTLGPKPAETKGETKPEKVEKPAKAEIPQKKEAEKK